MSTTPLSRFRQGIHALFAYVQPFDDALPREVLSPALWQAFTQLQRSEQQHSIRVLRRLRATLPAVPYDLAVAALMHDSGKARVALSVWEKSFVVLARKVNRGWVARQSARPLAQAGWARGFIVAEHHPEWSASLLEQADASERAIWLVRHHQIPYTRFDGHPHQDLLRQLQNADDLS
jgi:hypothetical protein